MTDVDPADRVRARGMAPGTLRRDSCPLCGESRLEPWLALRDRQLLQCPTCGVRCTDLYGEREAIHAYYSAVEAHHGKVDIDGGSDDAALRAIARSQADAMERLCGARRHGRFLEIGASRGHLLHEMETRGWVTAGIEVSSASVVAAKERVRGTVHLGDVSDAPFEPGSFQRIALFDVLAHLADPVAELREVVKLLEPGGMLVLSTVNEDWPLVPVLLRLFQLAPARTADLRDEMYEGQHYCYFSAGNVGRLMEAVGLRLDKVEPLEPLSTRYFVHHYGLPRRLALLGMVRLDRLLGSGRKMLVSARKPRGRAGS